MSFRDIFGLILSIGIYILPFALVICFVLSLIYSHYKDIKKTKMSDLLCSHCDNCMHRYIGADYLYHCDITEKIAPKFCNPKDQWLYRRRFMIANVVCFIIGFWIGFVANILIIMAKDN